MKKTIEIITKEDDNLTAFYCWGLEKTVLDKILMYLNGIDVEVTQSEVPGLMTIAPPFEGEEIDKGLESQELTTVPVADVHKTGNSGFTVPDTISSIKNTPNSDLEFIHPADELCGFAKQKNARLIKEWAEKYGNSEDVEFIKICLKTCCYNVFKRSLVMYLAARGIYDGREEFSAEKFKTVLTETLEEEISAQMREDLIQIFYASLKPFLSAKL